MACTSSASTGVLRHPSARLASDQRLSVGGFRGTIQGIDNKADIEDEIRHFRPQDHQSTWLLWRDSRAGKLGFSGLHDMHPYQQVSSEQRLRGAVTDVDAIDLIT